MSGRCRKSKNYTEPADATPVIAYRDRHPLRSARAGEAFLLSTFIAQIYAYWSAEFDPAKTAEDLDVLLDIAARFLPRETVAEWTTEDVPDGEQGDG